MNSKLLLVTLSVMFIAACGEHGSSNAVAPATEISKEKIIEPSNNHPRKSILCLSDCLDSLPNENARAIYDSKQTNVIGYCSISGVDEVTKTYSLDPDQPIILRKPNQLDIRIAFNPLPEFAHRQIYIEAARGSEIIAIHSNYFVGTEMQFETSIDGIEVVCRARSDRSIDF